MLSISFNGWTDDSRLFDDLSSVQNNKAETGWFTVINIKPSCLLLILFKILVHIVKGESQVRNLNICIMLFANNTVDILNFVTIYNANNFEILFNTM